MNHRTLLLPLIGLGLILLIAIGCSAPQPTPAPAVEAESIVKAWIAAYAAKDADKYLSLFGSDGEFMDPADPGFKGTGPQKMRNLQEMMKGGFATKEFAYKITSYFISPDGRFAAAEGTYTYMGNQGKVVTTPCASILEFKDGKITKETVYYDGSQFY